MKTTRFLPVKVHVGGEWFGTVVENKSVEWSKCTVEPHFEELLALNLNMTSLLRHHDIFSHNLMKPVPGMGKNITLIFKSLLRNKVGIFRIT